LDVYMIYIESLRGLFDRSLNYLPFFFVVNNTASHLLVCLSCFAVLLLYHEKTNADTTCARLIDSN